MALTDNINAYWKLDESSGNAVDSVGTNTATNTNVTYVSGKINNGASFNGSTSKLALTSVPITGNNVFSVSCWVKLSATSASTMWYWGTTAASQSVFLLYDNANTRIGFGAFGVNLYYTQTLSTGTWYHFVVTYDQTNERLYMNGSLVSTQALSSLNIASTTARIGIDIGDNASSDWNGVIDEVGVWARVLSATEVSSLYNGGNGLQYPFSNTTGASLLAGFVG